MATAIDLQASSAPSESWDDDFDFQSQSSSPKRPKIVHENPATMRMSTATEDWDIDNPPSTMAVTNHEPRRQSNILTDKINIIVENLANWAEEDPSTPQKASFPVETATENWDDDFLDKTDSPAQRSSRSNNNPSRHSIGGKLRAGVPLNHRKPLCPDDDEEHESWDDEFDFSCSPAKPAKSSTPVKSRRMPVRHTGHRASQFSSSNFHYSSDEDADANFTGVGAEEDRTVTASSRRTPQLHTPPPPLPSIPFALTPLAAAASTSTNTHLTAPSPRSPTTSVFSVPGSSIADTTSLQSTAPLRPSLSRNPASHGLRYVPPSPPLQRERRRLRKKSRPHPQGVMELVDISHRYPLSDTDVDQRLDEVDERRTPSPPPASIPISTSVPPTPSHSANTGGALLSRIGSVKRWSSRRKKGDSTPSDVTKDEKGKDIIRPDGPPTPRPRTSLSSLIHSNQQSAHPPASSSWFFRPTSPVNTQGLKSLDKTSNSRSSFTGSRSGSMTDLSLRGSIYASSSNLEDDDFSRRKPTNKLLKRKSLGFMQLKRSLMQSPSAGPVFENGDDPPCNVQAKLSLKRPMSMQSQGLPSGARPIITQRHASYGTATPTRATDASSEGLPQSIRDHKTSTSRYIHPKAKAAWKEKENEEIKENLNNVDKEKDDGHRSFMGSMRRLSLVSRHRRNKSGASLMETMTRLSSEALSPAPLLVSSSNLDDPPLLPPLPPMSEFLILRSQTSTSTIPALLPPIELHPPSPPRLPNVLSNSVTCNFDSLLSPVSFDSSVAPATSSTSAYASTTTFSSSSSSLSSSPRSPPPRPKSSPLARSSPLTKIPKTPKTTTSPYSASLGRSTISPKHPVTTVEAFPRRNSLSDLKSDLKIPARISQAQQGLKRDLGMVRDFSVYIEQLKKQQVVYHDLVQQMQNKLDIRALQQPAQRTVSPSFFNLTKPKVTRSRSNTNPGDSPGTRYKELAAAFYTINSKYRISWECAELLVDLADGTSAAVNGGNGGMSSAGGPSSSVSAPVGLSVVGGKGRERAITLAGDPSTPTVTGTSVIPSSSSPDPTMATSSPGWRALTGRHDLNHRQLVLLREMLNNAEAVLSADGSIAAAAGGGGGVPSSVPEEAITESTDDLRVVVNREWRWGNPMSSTVTLPATQTDQVSAESLKKKRRKSRLVGMSGIRDMLRALKKNVSESSSIAANRDQLSPQLPVNHNHGMISTASLGTEMSLEHSSVGHGNDNPSHQTPTTPEQKGEKSRSNDGPEVVKKPGKERGRDGNPRGPTVPSPYGAQLPTKSPRRPSLASIFRLGRKHTKLSVSTTDLSLHGGSGSHYTDISPRPGTSIGNNISHHQRASAGSPSEEDWDRMDSASDLDVAARALGISAGSKEGGSTLRLHKAKSPYLQYQASSLSTYLARPSTPRRSASGSQLSLFAESPSKQKARIQITPRVPRLSNVNEDVENVKIRDQEERQRERERPRSSSGKYQKSGSVRSMPLQPIFSERKLAMTPENIKPLLENAKEIHARLGDCIMEIQRLLDADGPTLGDRSVSGSSWESSQSGAS